MSKRQTTFIPGKPFWVNVRQEHIDAGRLCDPDGCPIYLALHERVPSLVFDVLAEELRLYDGSSERTVPLPGAAIEWREAFDAGAKSYPFRFKLVIPERREANG